MQGFKIIPVLLFIFLGLFLIRGFVHSETDLQDVSLQGDPRSIAINPFTNQAIVTSTRPNEVSIVDLHTQSIITAIRVGKRPLGVAIDPDLNYGLVTSRHDDTLSVIDLNTYGVIATIPVGRSPEGVAVNRLSGTLHVALVSNSRDDSVSVIDLGTLSVIQTIDVGRRPRNVPGGEWNIHGKHFWTMDGGERPRDIAIDSDLRLALVVNEKSRNVSVIDLKTYEVIGSVSVGKEPRAISINPETHLAVVTDEGKDSITIIDLQNWQMTSLHVEDHPLDVAVNVLDNRALVLCDRDRSLVLVDLSTNTVVESYSLNKKSRGVAVNSFTNIGAVIDDKTDSISLHQLPNPVPTITSISPDRVARGSGQTRIKIEGSGFITTSTVFLPAASLHVDFIDNHHLDVTIPESLLPKAGTYQLVVTNPSPEGGSWNPVDLQVHNPIPSITGLEPSEAEAGATNLTLTVHGTGFFHDTILYANKISRAFNLVDQTKLQVQLTAQDLEVGPYLEVMAENFSPGGGRSEPKTFIVKNPAPLLSAMDPTSIIAGGPDFTLGLTGDNFVKTSSVSFNGQLYPSKFISKTQIETTISSDAIKVPGDCQVKVISPAPGGGETTSLTFTVKPSISPPLITGFTPIEGPVGTPVTITGSNFNAGGLRIGFNGTSAIFSKSTKTSITATVPMGTTTGPISVTTTYGSATSSSNFKVTSLYDFNLSVTPQNARTAPLSDVGCTISVTGTENFSNLVALSVQGLPQGFSGYISPKTITRGQSSTLIITTCDCTLSDPVTLTIIGSSTIEGRVVTKSAQMTLEMVTPGVTTLTGRVLNIDKQPVQGVTIKVGESTTTTDQSGNFLLENPPTGEQVVLIQGFTASTETVKYPTIPLTMNIVPGQTNSLPYVPHLHYQKDYNFTPIDRAKETKVEDPELPGFQLRIPAGVDIVGWDGNVNTRVSVIKVPIDALPVPPPPPNVQGRSAYMFYFDKIGGGTPTIPIPVTAPNDLGLKPGEKAELWYFNESPNLGEAPNEWSLAGTCTVSDDGETISTDPGVGIPRFCCGAIIISIPYGVTGTNVPASFCKTGQKSVEPSSGVFLHSETDLMLPGRIPIALTRYHRSLDSFQGPYGIGTYFSYDQYLLRFGDTAVLVIPKGSRISFTRQPNGNYINNNEPMYRGAIVNFDSGGTGTLRMKDGMTYKFDGYGLLIEQADRYGSKLRFIRDVEENVVQIIGTDGKVMANLNYATFLDRNVVTEIIDFTGRKVTYSYDYTADPGTGRLMSVTNPEGGITQYQYDTQGRIESIVDPRGNTTVNVSYDANGRVCQEQYADGGAYKFYYITIDQATKPAAMKLLAEAAAGGPISTPACSGLQTLSRIAYTIAVDPNGNPVTYRFNNYQQIISVTDANGQTTITERDPFTNLVRSRTDALGRKTKYTYDSNSNVTSITDPAGNRTAIEYDLVWNNLTKITNALGNVTTMTYDSKGNLIQFLTPNSELTTIDYNQYGQPISVTDPMGNTTSVEYDDSGKLTKITDPLGNSASMKYDTLSRLSESTDAIGRKTTYSYDLMNRFKHVTNTLNGSTKFDYDPNGNLLSVTDAMGQTITYTYNSSDRVERMEDQLGKVESYEYDFNGNLVRVIDRKRQVTNYGHDKVDRLEGIAYADGSYTTYAYDAVGRLTSVYDSISGPLEYSYSDTGCATGCSGGGIDKVIRETTPLGLISYAYDAIGRRISMTVAGQPAVNYQYDPNSRLTEINSIINGAAATFSLRHDALGRRTSLSYPNGVTTNYTYDITNKLLNLQYLNPLNQVLESLNYTYDENGNRSNMNRLNVPVRLPDPKSNISYNSANQMVTFDDKSMAYDENGNLTSITNSCGTTTYTWDARNRLASINGFASALTSASTCEALTASFKYDAFGRRIEKTVNGRTIQYFNDRVDIVEEIENGTISATYLRTLNIDELLARLTPDTSRFFQTDALGSVIALVDENGTIKTTYNYDPYGNVAFSGEQYDNPFQYTARENDGTGLYYYRARYYSPKLQRFISEDPIGLSGGIDLFTYVANNPINYIDLWGLAWLKFDPSTNTMVFSDDSITYTYEARENVEGNHTPIEAGFHADDVAPKAIDPSRSFGPGDITYIETGHPAGKDIHGGGDCPKVSNPYANRQGWCPTYGCIRMQNEDIRDLSQRILNYKKRNPGARVPFDVVTPRYQWRRDL